MKKLFYLSLLLFVYSSASFARQNEKKSESDTTKVTSEAKVKRAKNVYVELGGPGLIYSANFEARFKKTRNGLGGRIGAGYIDSDSDKIFTLPAGLNYLLGKGKHFFEMGLGATYVSYEAQPRFSFTYVDSNGNTTTSYSEDDKFNGISDNGVLGTMTFGYRLQPISSGFSFRGQFNTLFGYGNFIPYGGLSLGYTF